MKQRKLFQMSSPKLTHQYREGNRAYLYALDPHASRLAYFFI
uniref:Uncharacterized protein n=1 Tax=Cucumis melo TaxID=3656 RepID=A0A9I9CC12_CUCME